jgi:ferredoxin like protein
MTTEPEVKVEDKLYQNRYRVDSGNSHIAIKPHETPSPELLALVKICPAHCYTQNDNGQVEVAHDGCMECGTCRVLAEGNGDISWTYPRGGYGVLFKFG